MNYNLLLVEDDITIANLYRIKLSNSGHKVIHATDGVIGMQQLKRFTPDIVLLDLMMPRMNGEAFLRRFRQLEAHQTTPVIILTNLSRSEAPKTLWHYGISGYFVKAHHTPSELVAEITKVMTLAKSENNDVL